MALYRVNNAGEFNSPYGYYRNPNIVNAPVLRAVSAYFNAADIHFSSIDYSEVLSSIKKGTFVYIDRPMTRFRKLRALQDMQKAVFPRMNKYVYANAVMN